MIIPLTILIYKLIIRFPAIVILIYVSQFYSDVIHETKIEAKEGIETVEFIHHHTGVVNKQAKKIKKEKEKKARNYVTFEQKYNNETFVVSAYLKLYILYSNFSMGERRREA